VARLLSEDDLHILGWSPPPAGQQHTRLLSVAASQVTSAVEFHVKWRAASTAHGLNDPRREVLAHATQALFLPPDEWVAPAAASHCFDVGAYGRSLHVDEVPTFEGTRCLFGTLSYWLEGVHSLEQAEGRGWLRTAEPFDAHRAEHDELYRRTLADVNLLNYLVANGDTHDGQFVVVGDRQNLALYCVDFTIAFSDFRNPVMDQDQQWATTASLPPSGSSPTERFEPSVAAAPLGSKRLHKKAGARGVECS
jgi:hypothetical protein